MPIFINGKQVSPIVSILGTVVSVLALGALVVFALPFIGFLVIGLLIAVLGVMAYGLYYRWRYGDPLQQFMNRFHAQTMNQDFTQQDASFSQSESQSSAAPRSASQARVGVRRTTTVEDAEVIAENKRTPG